MDEWQKTTHEWSSAAPKRVPGSGMAISANFLSKTEIGKATPERKSDWRFGALTNGLSFNMTLFLGLCASLINAL
jgi:hypothetical protein